MTLPTVYNHLWQSTVFAAAAGLLTLTLRKNRARVRHGLWLAASIKFLIPLSLLIGLGNQIQWRRVPSSDLSAAVVAVSEPFTMPLAAAPPPAKPSAPPPAKPSAPPPAKPSRPAADPLPAILATVWALGFLGIATSWWVRWRRIAAVVRAASPVPLDLPIPAVTPPTVVEPGVFGVVRPMLLLPAGIFERLSPEQLNAVFAHELYHVRHHDNLVAAFHMFVETVFWFHPMVWWIGRRMVEERERACDEGVLSMGGEPRVYAEAVLNVCKLYVEAPLECVSGITGADLKRRIEVIMTKQMVHDLDFAKKLGLAIAALAALLAPVFIGMIHTPAAQAQSAAATPVPAPAPVAVSATTAPAPAPVAVSAPTAAAPETVAVSAPTAAAPETVAVSAPTAAARAEKPRPRAIPVVAMAAQVVAQAVAKEPQISPAAAPAEAQKIRRDWAQANLPNRAMAATYTEFGPPDRKERTGAAETWQYNYLDAYQSGVTIEFAPGTGLGARITWPTPSIFEGSGQNAAAATAPLANQLGRDLHLEPALAPTAGLPRSDAFIEPSLRLNRAEHLMNLLVPAGSLSGRVDLIGQVKDEYGTVVANLRDAFDSTAGTWQSSFVLLPGSYVCNLVVREQASGAMYSESIPFQVSK